MTILELEKLTDLDRATIRFYEREGMVSPSRKENSYRDYSEADLQEILKIKLLRQLDVPLSQIKELQQGSADIAFVLRRHSELLLQKISTTERSAEICKEISNSGASYSSLNAIEFLEKMKISQEDCQGVSQSGESRPVQFREYHPVRRFVARMLDYAIIRGIIRFVLIVVLRLRPFDEWTSSLISYAIPFLCVPLMALSLIKFGTTPGKWMMGIRVEILPGFASRMRLALEREWNALRYGYGFGIPFWKLWRLYRSCQDYGNAVTLAQDEDIDYIYTDWNIRKKCVFTAICAFIIAIFCINTVDSLKPKYRGNDLTVAEFAENYNFYAKVLDESFAMNPDGTWYNPQSHIGGGVAIVIDKADKPNEPFRFEAEGERITRITYSNSWQNISFVSPLGPKMITAILTSVMSQEDIQILQLKDILNEVAIYTDHNDGNVTIENIQIRWKIKAENCTNYNGTYYTMDKEKPSRLEFDFEIIING